MTLDLLTPNPEADAERRVRLRRMRTLAVSLLVLAAVVYVATLGREGWLGFVNAAAEASMVGAMADWFAVTALFKHPMGIPIPHTALVPKRKDELGRSLEDFVQENFLQEQVLRDRYAAADPARRAGEWLSDRKNAASVVREASTLITLGLDQVRDEDVAAVVTEVIVPRLVEEPISPVAGALLDQVVSEDAHHGLVDLALEELQRWLIHNQEQFTDVLEERAPWWAPPALNEKVTARVHLAVVRWVADVRRDPDHSARIALDSFLAQLARDLLTDQATQERAERLKQRLLEQPQLIETGLAIWRSLRGALVDGLRDEDGPLTQGAVDELTKFGGRLVEDAELRKRIDVWGADLTVFLVGRYGGEATAVITHTIDRWDGKQAARKIELHVGRDLQFIRINGTIVGGLVGLIIHAVSVLIA